MTELDLSDAFRDCTDIQLELKVRVIDICYSSHNKVVAKNDAPGQYSRFIQIVDACKNIELNLDEAMKMAVNMAIENNILTEFLKQHSLEMRNMIALEYNEGIARRVERRK